MTAASVVTVGGKKYSLGAIFKKATQPIYTGNLGDYSGAKAICESTVGSPTAHMCTAEELVRSTQLGVTVPSGRYSSGAYAALYETIGANGGNVGIDDCTSWTDNATTPSGQFPQHLGAFWKPGPGYGACSTSAAVLCCD